MYNKCSKTGDEMKRILLIFSMLFLIVGCSKSNLESNVEFDITGMWVEIEENKNGQIIDYRDNKNDYLEITNNNISFYSYYDDAGTFAVDHYFYKLKNNKLYIDNEEFEDNNWENQVKESPFGSSYIVDLKDDILILKDGRQDNHKKTITYERISMEEFPIIEE